MSNKRKFDVAITETLEKHVIVEASNPEEAEKIAKENYDKSADGYVLDSSDFIGTDFLTIRDVTEKEST